MRVSGTDPQDKPRDDERLPLRRAVVWGIIGLAILLGVVLYFRYERVLAPLVSS
jgi:type VI protein secretion system component VasF